MRFARAILWTCLLVLLANPPTLAQDDTSTPRERWEDLTPEEKAEKLRLFDERWDRLSREEQEHRLQAFEEHLKSLTPHEREEFLGRLRRIRERGNVEQLREKHEKLRRFEERFLEDLPDDLENQVRDLPETAKGALLRHAGSRTIHHQIRIFRATLPEETRRRLESLEGRERFRYAWRLMQEQALARLPERERRRISGLPESERRQRLRQLTSEVLEEYREQAREVVHREIRELLEMPLAELGPRLKGLWIRQELRELGLTDEALLARTEKLPLEERTEILHRLRSCSTREDAEKMIQALHRTLPK